MVRRRLAILRSLILIALSLPVLWGQADYQKTVQPVLAKNCVSCHSNKLKVANLSLEQFHSEGAVWEKVLEKVSTGRMPPAGSPALSKAETTAVTGWIEKTFPPTAAAAPGRVTAHRLNRVEYNNTVRDLLGVALHPADQFPLDDTGYGFDNIGDVLSVSPLLMEKYTAAARAVSRVAVYGEPVPQKPSKLIRFLGKKLQDDPTANALPFSYRGALWATWNFPVEGEYEFHMRVANYRPRDKSTPRQKELSLKRGLSEAEKAELMEYNRLSDPPVKMVMTVDGKPVLSEIVEGNIDYQYAHGESVARMHLKAGEHSFRASYPEFAGMAHPLENVNTDGRRKLFIDYFDIIGPFNPVAAPPESRKQIYVCAQKTPECSRKILETLARRAYRRALTKQEVEGLANLATMVRKDSESFDEGIRVALQAILMSPNFLFRVEREPVSEYDLAARLSYFLWSTMPDEELLRLADEGRLRKPGVMDAQVRRMMADARADALIGNFTGQWLGLRQLERRKPDPGHFPLVDDELLDSMRQETTLFARAVMRENRSVLDFLDGKFTYVNGPLALYYGIPGVKGEEFQRVELDGVQRGGVLTQGAILTQSSYATRTSPVLRGKWVLENLLGTPPPPPPPDVPALEEKNLGTTVSMRQRLDQHRANPACAVCHTQMDPIGFGLENYDASGAWRDREGNFAVDSAGTLPGGASFKGPGELKQILRAQPDLFVRNLTEKMLTYALGRGLEAYDRPVVGAIVRHLAADDYRFSTLVMDVVKSELFQMRKEEIAKNAR
jgi:hypothetical protein